MPQFIVVPNEDVTDGALTTLANATFSNTANLSGLTNGAGYRAFALSTVSPLFTPAIIGAAPTLSGGSIAQSGNDLVITEPTASGDPTPTTTLVSVTRDGINITASLVGLTIPNFVTGVYSVLFTASNGVSPDANRILTGTFTAAADITASPVSLLSSVALGDNMTATFWDAPTGGNPANAQVVFDALGQPSVIANPDVYVRFSPTAAGEAYGTMVNPHRLSNGNVHGFDRRMETSGTIKTTVRLPYIPALDVEASSGPGLPLDAPMTYIKHYPRGSFGDGGNALEYGVLTVLPDVPPLGFFRPGTSIPTKIVVARAEQINMNVLQELADVSGSITLASVLDRIPLFRFGNGYGGESLRNLSNDRAGTASAYMSTSGTGAALAYNRLHIGPNDATKEQAVKRLIQIGLDRYSDYLGGWRGASGAGQYQKELEAMVFAGFSLNSQEILDAAKEINQNVVGQIKWVPQSAAGYSAGWPTGGAVGSNQRRWNASIKDVHVGQPFLFQANTVQSPLHTLAITQRYLTTTAPALTMGLLFILLLRNGPGGQTGLDWWLSSRGGNGLKNTTNDRAAAVMWLDRYMKYPDLAVPDWIRNFYEVNRSLIDIPKYSGPGLTFERESPNNGPYVTNTTDGFTFNWSACNWSTGLMNSVQTRFSQDGVQFISVPNVGSGESGSVSVVPGANVALTVQQHYVQMRYRNLAPNGANYWSEWSPNFSYVDQAGFSGLRLMATPTGVRANHEPVFLHEPLLFAPVNPRTDEPAYYPVSGEVSASEIVLVAGCGYIDAHPVATRQYQLFVGGSAYGLRQSSPKFVRNRDIPALTDIFVRVYANNGIGAEVFADTNVIQFAAQVDYPADIVFDSSFSGSFDIDWPNVRDTMVGSGGTLTWNPFELVSIEPPGDLEITSTDIPQTTPGIIKVAKNGTNPKVGLNLAAQRPLVIGNKYRVEFDVPINSGAGSPALVRLGTVVDGSDIYLNRVDQFPQPKIHKAVAEFTATAVDLWLSVLYLTATGGTVGGDPIISNCIVREITDFSPVAYPTPYATPVVIYDTAVDGFDLTGWTVTNNVSASAAGFLLDAGADWPQLTRDFIFPEGEVGREIRVTVTASRVSGSALARMNISRAAYVDPDYGPIPVGSGLYVSERQFNTGLTTYTDVFRAQNSPNIRANFNVRSAAGGYRISGIKVEML
ncbi:MAG: hypothetical protein ACK4MS_10480 [Paracoccaceae bacterium]